MTSKLDAIPIASVRKPRDTLSPGNALAVLHEIEAMLEALVETGKTNSIDLRRTPLTPEDYDDLKTILGEGEVRAELQALGGTRIRETAVSGVWWITHHNSADQVLGEFIEVAQCPEILMAPEQDLRAGQKLLRARLEDPLPVMDSTEIAKRLKAMGLSRNHKGSYNNPDVNQPVKRGNGNAG